MVDEAHSPAHDPVLIKRYAGRRYYDTAARAYVSLEDMSRMVLGRIRFIVRDAETGEDITRDLLRRLH